MTSDLKGWHPDPFGIHEFRFFSQDGKPTRLVSDNNSKSYDDPPTTTSNTDPASDPIATLDGASISQVEQEQAEPPVVPAVHLLAPAGWFPDPKNPKQLRYWDGLRWTEHTSRSGSFLAQDALDQNTHSGRLLPIAVITAAVLVVAGAIGLLVIGHSSAPPGIPIYVSLGTTTTTQTDRPVQSATGTSMQNGSTTTSSSTSTTTTTSTVIVQSSGNPPATQNTTTSGSTNESPQPTSTTGPLGTADTSPTGVERDAFDIEYHDPRHFDHHNRTTSHYRLRNRRCRV